MKHYSYVSDHVFDRSREMFGVMGVGMTHHRFQSFKAKLDGLDKDNRGEDEYFKLLESVEREYEKWLDAPVLVHANAYRITRHYGGPEEGGWWYDRGEPLGSLPCASQREAREACDKMRKKFKRLAKGDISSVLGGAEVGVYIEDGFAKPFPESRPIYE